MQSYVRKMVFIKQSYHANKMKFVLDGLWLVIRLQLESCCAIKVNVVTVFNIYKNVYHYRIVQNKLDIYLFQETTPQSITAFVLIQTDTIRTPRLFGLKKVATVMQNVSGFMIITAMATMILNCARITS